MGRYGPVVEMCGLEGAKPNFTGSYESVSTNTAPEVCNAGESISKLSVAGTNLSPAVLTLPIG